jgi:hypothetical protein
MLLDHNFEWCLSEYCTDFLYVGSVLHMEVIRAASHKFVTEQRPLGLLQNITSKVPRALSMQRRYQMHSSVSCIHLCEWPETTVLFQCLHEPSPGLSGFSIPNTIGHWVQPFLAVNAKQLLNSLPNLPVRAVESTMNCGLQEIVPLASVIQTPLQKHFSPTPS